jgi:AraC-like DNA-binding protein
MQYLQAWRMQLAGGLLAGGRTKVCAVAEAVGYRSEAAFSRAFKRHTGLAPGKWHRR